MKKLVLLVLVAAVAFFSAPVYAGTLLIADTFGTQKDLDNWLLTGDVSIPDAQLVLNAASEGSTMASRSFSVGEGYTGLILSYDYELTGGVISDDYIDIATITLDMPDGETETLFRWDSSMWENFENDLGITSGCYTQIFNLSEPGNFLLTFVLNEAFGSAQLSIDNVTIAATSPSAPVPVPATLLLLGSGLAGLAVTSRKRQLKK